jgi:SAM-dependent methyltransferase
MTGGTAPSDPKGSEQGGLVKSGSLLNLRTRLLWSLDRWFPPDASAFLSCEGQTLREARRAIATVGSYLAELDSADVDVLDYGCGWGGETIWLAERVRSVTGVDVDARAIAQAQATLSKSGLPNCRFALSPDGRLPIPDMSFDAVFSTDTFEHVQDLDLAFSEIYRVLRKGGALITRFGPLFYSPHGYHLYWACRVPFAHVLFGLTPILRLREARSGATYSAATWDDMGLNQKRFRDYERSARRAGFVMTRFEAIPVRRLHTLARVPLLGDFLTFGVDCLIRRPG